MEEKEFLYCDGGVVKSNPSPFAGTWAFVHVRGVTVVHKRSGVIATSDLGQPATNNVTELLALIAGLKYLPDDWVGEICSDSAITLGRAFSGFAWKNVPNWMIKEFGIRRKRLKNWQRFTYTLLDGHPTKAHLLAGVGKRGHPVSEFNVMCDKMCSHEAEKFWALVQSNK